MGQGLGGREYCCERREQLCVKQLQGSIDPQALSVSHGRGWTLGGHLAGKFEREGHTAGDVKLEATLLANSSLKATLGAKSSMTEKLEGHTAGKSEFGGLEAILLTKWSMQGVILRQMITSQARFDPGGFA